MKKLIILSVVALFLIPAAMASQADLFKINTAEIMAEMEDLIELEAYVSATNQTFSELQLQESSLLANVMISEGMHGLYLLDGPPLGIPSFLWGFCLGVPGLAVVYFITEDKNETQKALWGCVISGVVSGVLYLALYGTYFAAAATM